MTYAVAVRATPGARARVVDTVVAAFAEDPAFRYFFDREDFREQAAAFAGYLFDRRIQQGNVWVVEGGLSVAMWDGPEVDDSTTSSLYLPAEVLARIDTFHDSLRGFIPETPHWYLGVLATHPAHAGNRWGRLTMAAGLEEAAKDQIPAYLETATPGNLDLYRRSGWTIAGETKTPIPVWVMKFDPLSQPPSSAS